MPTRWILDTNVFRELAHGNLRAFESDLLRLASRRDPPVLFIGELTYLELMAHVTEEEAQKFGIYREALQWADKLCSIEGLAEIHQDAIRNAIHVNRQLPAPDPDWTTFHRYRRQILKYDDFKKIPEEIRLFLQRVAKGFSDKKSWWADDYQTATANLAAKLKEAPFRGNTTIAIVDAFLEVLRETAQPLTAIHGHLRKHEESREMLREFLYFEAATVQKSVGRGYNFRKHRNDYVDQALCAYPAAGYTLVTEEKRLRQTLRTVQCPIPRVISVAEMF